MFESHDEIAAASENELPISYKRQIELMKICNDVWQHMTVQHACTPLEAQLVASWLSTYARNHGQGGEK